MLANAHFHCLVATIVSQRMRPSNEADIGALTASRADRMKDGS
jgi:hypothetical protein